MSSLHNAIRGPGGRVVLAVKRALGITDADSGVERFSETLQPILDVWSRPEFHWLRAEYLFSRHMSVAAVAGQLGGAMVSLPPNIQAIAVIERISLSAGAANVTGDVSSVDRATVLAAGYTTIGGAAGARDQRLRGVATAPFAGIAPAVELSQGTSVGTLVINRLDHFSVLANSQGSRKLPYIIRPGGGLLYESDTVNQVVDVIFSGYVRSALPSELV